MGHSIPLNLTFSFVTLGMPLLASDPTGALTFGLGVILLLSAAKTLRDLRRARAPV